MLECRQSLRRQLIALGAEQRFIRRLDVKRWHELMRACKLYRQHGRQFTKEERKDIWKRMKATYGSFRFSDLPLNLALAPFRAMMPTFRLFYIEQVMKQFVNWLIR